MSARSLVLILVLLSLVNAKLTPVRIAMGQTLVVDSDRDGNFIRIENAVRKAVKQNADIILFSETSILGWVNPMAWMMADSIPGNDTKWVGEIAKKHQIMIGIGITEKFNASTLHDTAILIDKDGSILLVHRKINLLAYLMNPPYTPGPLTPANLPVVSTRFGRIGMLICADTFKDEIIQKIAMKKPQLMLIPYGWAGPFDIWPKHGLDLQHRVQNVANITKAFVFGVDNVGSVSYGPWTGQEYGGFSVASDPKLKVLAVAADRDVDLVVTEIEIDVEE